MARTASEKLPVTTSIRWLKVDPSANDVMPTTFIHACISDTCMYKVRAITRRAIVGPLVAGAHPDRPSSGDASASGDVDKGGLP